MHFSIGFLCVCGGGGVTIYEEPRGLVPPSQWGLGLFSCLSVISGSYCHHLVNLVVQMACSAHVNIIPGFWLSCLTIGQEKQLAMPTNQTHSLKR